jgi:hypothetical protein
MLGAAGDKDTCILKKEVCSTLEEALKYFFGKYIMP